LPRNTSFLARKVKQRKPPPTPLHVNYRAPAITATARKEIKKNSRNPTSSRRRSIRSLGRLDLLVQPRPPPRRPSARGPFSGGTQVPAARALLLCPARPGTQLTWRPGGSRRRSAAGTPACARSCWTSEPGSPCAPTRTAPRRGTCTTSPPRPPPPPAAAGTTGPPTRRPWRRRPGGSKRRRPRWSSAPRSSSCTAAAARKNRHVARDEAWFFLSSA
jgi:hypothetical protein